MNAPSASHAALTPADIQAVSPALAKYTRVEIQERLWHRPGLSLHDRALATCAALIARNQTIGLPNYVNKALDGGVTPAELSELITHLAFYCGWANAFDAIAVVKDIFAQRGIGADQLPQADAELLPNQQGKSNDGSATAQMLQLVGAVGADLVQVTTDLLYGEVWRRPGLSPRDRGLITLSALVAAGQSGSLAWYLRHAVDLGVTQEQVSELLVHLAFYGGWPNSFGCVSIAKSFFEAEKG